MSIKRHEDVLMRVNVCVCVLSSLTEGVKVSGGVKVRQMALTVGIQYGRPRASRELQKHAEWRVSAGVLGHWD